MDVELTEQELAVVEGKDIEDGPAPMFPGDSPEVVSEEVPQQVEEQPKEVVVESAPDDGEDEDYVDVDALRAELDKQKKANRGLIQQVVDLRQSRKEDRDWRQGVQERLERLDEIFPADKELLQKVEEEPDRENDPVGWLAWKHDKDLSEKLRPIEEERQREEEEKELKSFMYNAANAAYQSEEAAIAQHGLTRESYEQKLDELRVQRINGYVGLGYDLRAAQEQVQAEEMQLVLESLNSGISPAEEVLRLHEYFKPPPLKKSGEHTGEDAVEEKKPLDVISAAEKAKSQGKLSSASGRGGSNIITFDYFATLPPDDPVFVKIANNERLFSELNINGKVTI